MTPEQEMRRAALEAARGYLPGALTSDILVAAQQFYDFIAQTNVDGSVVPPESIEYFVQRGERNKGKFQMVTYAEMTTLVGGGGEKLAILRNEKTGTAWAVPAYYFNREWVQVVE